MQPSSEERPAWSGVPLMVGGVIIVPLHVSDQRSIHLSDEWAHAGLWTSPGGDSEYHIYRRA